jgi:hypothetical protein
VLARLSGRVGFPLSASASLVLRALRALRGEGISDHTHPHFTRPRKSTVAHGGGDSSWTFHPGLGRDTTSAWH